MPEVTAIMATCESFLIVTPAKVGLCTGPFLNAGICNANIEGVACN